MEVEHLKKVSQMIKSAEGSAGLLHNITKPTAQRGGVQMLKKEEEDAKPMARCGEKKTEWAKHGQRGMEVQNQESKPWKNGELRKSEEDLPRLKKAILQKAARTYNTKTGVGCDGPTPNSRWTSQKRRGTKWWNSRRRWNSVENGRSKLAQRSS